MASNYVVGREILCLLLFYYFTPCVGTGTSVEWDFGLCLLDGWACNPNVHQAFDVDMDSQLSPHPCSAMIWDAASMFDGSVLVTEERQVHYSDSDIAVYIR